MNEETAKIHFEKHKIANEIALLLNGKSVEFSFASLSIAQGILTAKSNVDLSKIELDNNLNRIKASLESEHRTLIS